MQQPVRQKPAHSASPERPHGSLSTGQRSPPSEPPLPSDGAIQRITIAYPEATISLLGWSWEWSFAWMVVFFVLTMVFAFALKKPMGVEL